MGRASVAPEGSTNGFGTHIADVEVDPETGKVTVLRYTAIQDAGKAIHPSYVEGQMQGGAVQGIGWALNEEYWFDDQNRMRNASFLDYRMPTCLDVPMIDTIIVEVPNPDAPLRRPRRRRNPHRPAPGRNRQRHLPRHRQTPHRPSHVATEGLEGDKLVRAQSLASAAHFCRRRLRFANAECSRIANDHKPRMGWQHGEHRRKVCAGHSRELPLFYAAMVDGKAVP